jgi:hypothetical protein
MFSGPRTARQSSNPAKIAALIYPLLQHGALVYLFDTVCREPRDGAV